MFGWHHWFIRNELGQTPGDGEGQRSLVCCSPCSSEVRHDLVTEQQQHKQIPSLAHSTPRESSKELQDRWNLVWWGQEKTTSREIAITWIRKMCALWVRIRKQSFFLQDWQSWAWSTQFGEWGQTHTWQHFHPFWAPWDPFAWVQSHGAVTRPNWGLLAH